MEPFTKKRIFYDIIKHLYFCEYAEKVVLLNNIMETVIYFICIKCF